MANSVSNSVSKWLSGWFGRPAGRRAAGGAADFARRHRRAATRIGAAVESLEERRLLAVTTLTNGSGPGSLHVMVDAFGSYGATAAPAGDATFFPVGTAAAGGTTALSAVYFDPINNYLTETAVSGGGGLAGVPFTASSPNSATSAFDLAGYHFVLTQTIPPQAANGTSTLVQTYTITNNTGAIGSFPLVRTVDSNMNFSGPPNSDFGGASTDGRVVYAFDTRPPNAAAATPYFAITSLGGTSLGATVQPAPYTQTVIQNFRIPASDVGVVNPDANNDQITDVGYNLAVSLEDLFVLTPGATATYTTRTVFGSAAPAQVIGAGRVGFSNAVYSQPENGGPATITVQRTGGNTTAMTVNYATTNTGTATPGADFTPVGGILTFAVGQTTATFNVPIIDNNVSDGNRTIGLQLSSPSNGAVLGQDTATLTIIDNEIPGEFDFSQPTLAVDEGVGTVTLTVNRLGGSFGTASVDFRTDNGDAIAGQDFVPATGTLTFANGETSKTIDIQIIDDTLVEADEFFGVSLFNPTGGATLGPPSSINANITILDNDSGFSFSAPFYDVREDAGSAVITVNREGKTDTQQSVTYAATDGSATSPADYLSVQNVLTFDVGQTSATFTVPIVQDQIPEPTETVNLSLFSPTGGAAVRTPLSVLNIVDVDKVPPHVDLSRLAFLGGNTITGVVVGFDEPLDPNTVVVPSFALWSQGSITRFGTGADQPLTIKSVSYDPVNNTVTLFPAKPLKMNKIYRVTVAGQNGVTDLQGNPIDSNGDNQGGDTFNEYFGRGNKLTYLDSNGDQVTLSLTGGGIMELTRDFSGEGHDLRLLATRSNRSTLGGKIKPKSARSDGVTTLQNLIGATGVRNRLSTPPFIIGNIFG